MNLILISSHPLNIQGRESYWYYFIIKKKIFNVGSCSDIYKPISFKLSMMIEITEFCQFGWSWSSFKVSHIRNENFGVHFLPNLSIYWDKIQCVATSCWFVEARAKLILCK